MRIDPLQLADEVVSLLAENCGECEFKQGCDLDAYDCPLIRLYDMAAQILEDCDETQ